VSRASFEGLDVREVPLDERLYRAVRRLMSERPELGYLDEDEFTREALRHLIFED